MGTISKAQKQQKAFKVSSILLQYPKNPKVEQIGALKGDLFGFFNIIVSKDQKTEGGAFGAFFQKKSHNAKNTERGNPLVSPGTVCYAEKQGKPFWFSSRGEI